MKYSNNPAESTKKTDTIQVIHNHRTIRRFKQGARIPEEHVMTIALSGQRAATSCSGQMYSLLRLTDMEVRQRVQEICGKQEFIGQASEFFLLLADSYRLQRLVQASGGETRDWPFLSLLVSVFDVALVAQNMVLSAESLGYGTVFSGVCGDKALELIEALHLPKGVLPVAGLAIGIPDENPPVRPRIPIKYIMHENSYQEYTKEDLEIMIHTMNEGLNKEGYYKKYTGREHYTWNNHVARKFGGKWLEREDQRRREACEKQGFL